jgi:hypothetical protein
VLVSCHQIGINPAVHEVIGKSDHAGLIDDDTLLVVFVGKAPGRLDQLMVMHISDNLVLIVKEASTLCKCVPHPIPSYYRHSNEYCHHYRKINNIHQ